MAPKCHWGSRGFSTYERSPLIWKKKMRFTNEWIEVSSWMDMPPWRGQCREGWHVMSPNLGGKSWKGEKWWSIHTCRSWRNLSKRFEGWGRLISQPLVVASTIRFPFAKLSFCIVVPMLTYHPSINTDQKKWEKGIKGGDNTLGHHCDFARWITSSSLEFSLNYSMPVISQNKVRDGSLKMIHENYIIPPPMPHVGQKARATKQMRGILRENDTNSLLTLNSKLKFKDYIERIKSAITKLYIWPIFKDYLYYYLVY